SGGLKISVGGLTEKLLQDRIIKLPETDRISLGANYKIRGVEWIGEIPETMAELRQIIKEIEEGKREE
ncbi:MAG: hypothetical protein PF445_10970, partial [Melioribacteraceae bacterium]|nr:hypothetical protein [Melioribacteraceae bacterium]